MSAAAGRGFWAAIVGSIVLIAAATLLWRPDVGQRSAAVAPVDGSRPRTTADPAADYQAFASRVAGESADVEAVVEGLRRLAGAVGALEGTPPEVAVDLRVAAEHLLLNPEAMGTTEAVRNSLAAAADTLDRPALVHRRCVCSPNRLIATHRSRSNRISCVVISSSPQKASGRATAPDDC